MVESQPSKLLVAGPIPVSRSKLSFFSTVTRMQFVLILSIFAQSLLAQTAPLSEGSHDVEETVKIEKFTIQGTRLELRTVQALTGLYPGLTINDATVRKSLKRMLETGLVKEVQYTYESLSEPKSVALEFTITDELPLLPATIDLPGVDPDAVWSYLAGIDPLYTRELPRTEKALRLYSRSIESYLRTQKRVERVTPQILGDLLGTEPGGNATGVVFKKAPLIDLPPPPAPTRRR